MRSLLFPFALVVVLLLKERKKERRKEKEKGRKESGLCVFMCVCLHVRVCALVEACRERERGDMAASASLSTEMARRKQRSKPVDESKLVLESSFPSRLGRKRKMPTWLQDDSIAAEQRDIETAIKNSQVHTRECLDVGAKECPVFHPSEEEFSKPAAFIQSISEKIEKVRGTGGATTTDREAQ